MTTVFDDWWIQRRHSFQSVLTQLSSVEIKIHDNRFSGIKKATFELKKDNDKRSVPRDGKNPEDDTVNLSDEELVTAFEAYLTQPPDKGSGERFHYLINLIRKRALPKALTLQGIAPHCWEHRSHFLERFTINRWYRFYWDTIFLQHGDSAQNEWGNALAAWFGPAMADNDIVNHVRMKPWKACMLACLKSGSSAFLFDSNAALKFVHDCYQRVPDDDRQDIKRLTLNIAQQVGVPETSRGIKLYCEGYLFDALLAKYATNISDDKVLEKLLAQFCDWQETKGLERFEKLVIEAYKGSEGLVQLSSPIRKVIESHLKTTIGDPRLRDEAWGRCEQKYPDIYRRIKAWFVQADFDFFFDFAFNHSLDDHQRKRLWSKYLSQAEDFRVFLPDYAYELFQQSETDETRRMLVYRNTDDITGFVMLLSTVLIYEAVEKPNAAYIYDIETIDNDLRKEASRIREFVEELRSGEISGFNKSSRRLFKNEAMAPLPDEYGRESTPHRRFRHDAGRPIPKWHDEVQHYLSRQFFIEPDKD